MTTDKSAIAASMYGVWRLLCLDKRGASLIDGSAAGTSGSFIVAPVLFPLWLLTSMMADSWPAETTLHHLAAASTGYALAWVLFPLVLWQLVSSGERAAHWSHYVAAYNWSQVLIMAAYLPIDGIAFSGILPESLSSTLLVLVSVATIAYQWFIALVVLGTGPLTSAGVVALDALLSILVQSVIDGF